jgi:hypothetical protein
MKKIRHPLCSLCAALMMCIMVGCQPDGGDLLPLMQDGVQIAKTIVEGDTAQLTRGNLTVKARGRWRAIESETNFHFEVSNTGDEPVTINFAQVEMVNALGEKLKAGALIDEDAQTQPATLIPEGIAVIKSKQTRKFGLNFKTATTGKVSSSADLLGKTATLNLPTAGNQTVAGNFIFAFKYVESRY